jgi:hypothetical protein
MHQSLIITIARKKHHFLLQIQSRRCLIPSNYCKGPIETIQKKCEILSDIVSENNGKVHGNQSHMISNNSMSLIVYYEVPQGQRDEVINKSSNSIVTKLNK